MAEQQGFLSPLLGKRVKPYVDLRTVLPNPGSRPPVAPRRAAARRGMIPKTSVSRTSFIVFSSHRDAVRANAAARTSPRRDLPAPNPWPTAKPRYDGLHVHSK